MVCHTVHIGEETPPTSLSTSLNMANTSVNAARNLNLDVWDLEDLITAYEYRASGEIDYAKVTDAVNAEELDIQSVTEEVQTSIDNGTFKTVIDRTITTDPIVKEYDVEVNVKYEVPVETVINWDMNVTVDILTGEPTHNVDVSVDVLHNGQPIDGDIGNGNGGGNGNGNGGGNNSGNGNGNGQGNGGPRTFLIEPMSLEALGDVEPTEASVPDVVAMVAAAEPLA